MKKTAIAVKELPVGFTPLKDGALLTRLLEEAVLTKAKAEISMGPFGSTPDQRTTLKCQISGTSARHDSLSVLLPKKPSFKLAPKSEALLVIFMKGASVLCLHSVHLQLTGQQFKMTAPWRALRYQRRSTSRFEIPTGYEYFAEVHASSRSRLRILDLSTEGFSVFANARQAAALPKGEKAELIKFRLDGYPLTVSGRVVRQSSHTPRKGVEGKRIGFKFYELRREEYLMISAFVARHLAQYALE